MGAKPSGWREKVARLCPQARFDEPLKKHSTFRIGGPADCYVEIHSRGQLQALLRTARDKSVPIFMLGYGSNLLIQDGGVRGIVARLRGDFERVEFPGKDRVRAGAGARVPSLVLRCAERGLAGTEPLVGVPGTVGGALVMNAGTRDGEIGDLVAEVEILEPPAWKARRLARAQLVFSYRESSLNGRVALEALLQLKPGNKVDIMARVRQYQRKRLQTQPIHSHNVGSIFKNPPGLFVARLIEESGLKGMTFGGARVSPRHANFIENERGAKASDVLELVSRVRDRIRAAHGLELELEMRVVGDA